MVARRKHLARNNEVLTALSRMTPAAARQLGDSLSEGEAGVLDAVTAGTVTASKAVVVDSNKDISGYRHVTQIGPTGTGTASAAVLGLHTAETTIVDGDHLGRIEFKAPSEADGTDAVLVAASIWAEADDTFSATVNNTDLVFATGLSEAATEKMRLSSSGELTVTSAAAAALAVGRQGATSPALLVDASTASSATGIGITAAASGGGVAVAALGGAAEALTIDGKGTGTVTIAGTSTGNVIVPRAFAQGTDSTDRVVVKGIYMTPANVSVTVPSITDPDIARVQVDVSAALSFQPTLGDVVIAIPITALMSNCRLQGAYVYQTDGVEICFGSEGGNVTGAAHNFKFLFLDLT